MKHTLLVLKFVFISGVIMILNYGCYYDVEENLYPVACDTSDVKYSSSVLPIIMNNCYTCHNENSSLKLEPYSNLKIYADNGKLQCTINYTCNPMPRNNPKLSNCDIAKIEKWINSGALND